MLVTIALHACGGSDSPTTPTQAPTSPAPTTPPTTQPVSMNIAVNITSGTTALRGIDAVDPTVDLGFGGTITVELVGGGEVLDSVTVMIEGQTFDGTPFDAQVPFGRVEGSATQPFGTLPNNFRLPFPLPDVILEDVVVFGSGLDPATGDTVTRTNEPINVGPTQVDVLLPPPCVPSETTACLLDGRFQVDSFFDVFTSIVIGSGPVDGTTDDVLFGHPETREPFLQAAFSNQCAANDHFSVLLTPMGDVVWELVATDTLTGVSKSYTNPLGGPQTPLVDTQAFSTCP
jgi:hypothetical protein